MKRLLPSEEMRLLVKVSKLYYEENIRQDEIVSKLISPGQKYPVSCSKHALRAW
jgi:hypothetical protein